MRYSLRNLILMPIAGCLLFAGGMQARRLVASNDGHQTPEPRAEAPTHRSSWHPSLGPDPADSISTEGIRSYLGETAPGGFTPYWNPIQTRRRIEWAEKDPLGAIEDGKQDSNYGTLLIMDAFRVLAISDPDLAKSQLLSLPVGWKRRWAFQSFLSALGESDPERAVALLKDLDLAEDVRLLTPWSLEDMVENWGASDPDAAMRFIEDLPPRLAKHPLEDSFDDWARRDPLATIRWADSLTGIRLKQSALEAWHRGTRFGPDGEVPDEERVRQLDALIPELGPGLVRDSLVERRELHRSASLEVQ